MRAAYLLALLVIFLLIGCAAEQPSAPGAATEQEEAGAAIGTTAGTSSREASVDILADAFDPEDVTVRVGGKVTWTNADTKTHMIAGPRRLFSEKVLAGESYTHTFEEAGEYKILNVLAPVYYGTVIVE